MRRGLRFTFPTNAFQRVHSGSSIFNLSGHPWMMNVNERVFVSLLDSASPAPTLFCFRKHSLKPSVVHVCALDIHRG